MFRRIIFVIVPIVAFPIFSNAKVIKEKKGAFMLGVEVNFEMKDVEESSAHEEVEGTMYTTGAVLRLGFSPVEWFEIYVVGGTGNVFFGAGDFPYGMYLTDFNGSYEAKYGGGIRFNVLSPSERSTLGLFVDARYTRLTSRDRVEEGGGWGWVKEVVDWQELEFMLGLKRPFDRWVLIGGLRGSELLGTHSVEGYEWDMTSSLKVGVFSEMEFYLDSVQKTALFFGISLIDSNSVSFGFRRWL